VLGVSVKVASHEWLGADCRIGLDSRISSHAVLCDYVIFYTNTEINHHLLIDQIKPLEGAWSSGKYLEAAAKSPEKMISPEY
jgi:UDP-3-O-[3-hydroxymyristoyl] glucosamine N-acyltransferase